METIVANKYITVAYELYVTEDGEKDLVEKATPERPFQFISGMGTTLEAFEEQLKDLVAGDKFEFTISSDEAYGEYDEEHVLELPRQIFEIDGHFDSERIYDGNVVPLMDSEGHRINGTVVEVKAETVTMDMNHPLAGNDLTFVGEVLESREATNAEIQGIVNMMSGEESGCGCGGNCGCGSDESESGGCGCGSKEQEEGEGCGCGGNCGCGGH